MKPKSQLWYGAPTPMRLRVLVATAAFAASASSLAVFDEGTAEAKDCANPLISTCINSENLWPNAGPQRFVGVGSTETVARGQVGFGLVTSYLSRPIILQVASPGPGGSEQYVVDNQVNGNFLFAYGVTDRLQLDFAMPVTLIQTGAGTSPLTGGADLKDTAVRDLRFGFAYSLVPRNRISPDVAGNSRETGNAWSLAARLTFVAPTGDSSDFAGERTAVFAPAIAADYRYKFFFAGAEVGARIRPVTEFAGARVGTQLTTALGAGVDIFDRDRLALLAEARMYPNFPEQHTTTQSALRTESIPNGNTIIPAEWMLSARTAPILAGDVSFLFGGGGPIPVGSTEAITVPRWRFVLGITYAPTARDTDKDGVLDRDDLCPSVPGVRGGERPGCPLEENKQP